MAVAMISIAFWFGVRTSFSVFYVSLVDAFGWSRGATAGAQSVAMIVYAVAAPTAGTLVDRYGPRRIILPGAVLLVLSIAACASIRSLPALYLYYGLGAGISIACLGPAPFTAVLAHWFKRRRGLASGLAVSGMGLGVLVLVPGVQVVIGRHGWQTGFLVLAAAVAVLALPLNGLLLRRSPASMGLSAETEMGPAVESGVGTTDDRDWTLGRALRSVHFWALLAFPCLIMFPIYIVIVHFVAFLDGLGVSRVTAASALAMVGAVSAAGRVAWGWASDRLGREWTYTLGLIPFGLGLVCLLALEATGRQGLIVAFVILFGLGWGATAPMFMATAVDLFHGRMVGTDVRAGGRGAGTGRGLGLVGHGRHVRSVRVL